MFCDTKPPCGDNQTVKVKRRNGKCKMTEITLKCLWSMLNLYPFPPPLVTTIGHPPFYLFSLLSSYLLLSLYNLMGHFSQFYFLISFVGYLLWLLLVEIRRSYDTTVVKSHSNMKYKVHKFPATLISIIVWYETPD